MSKKPPPKPPIKPPTKSPKKPPKKPTQNKTGYPVNKSRALNKLVPNPQTVTLSQKPQIDRSKNQGKSR